MVKWQHRIDICILDWINSLSVIRALKFGIGTYFNDNDFYKSPEIYLLKND